MRACLYARYSSERQSETSLDDQIRRARDRAAGLGLTVVAVHADDAVSGSTPVGSRPAGKALLADALAARWDVLLLEGLDRLSRELGEQERIVKRLEHRGIRIVGVADGYDSQASGRKVMRIARGMINELYLDDLRHKTHRGLEGAVLRGMHAGGLSYGYRSEPVPGGHHLAVDLPQAEVVRRIFDDFGAGLSPQRIAHALNREQVPAPRGGTWAVSAIYGCPRKGSGILNNELYVGRYVWNRSQWLKDPDTGRRTRVDRPPGEWRIELRPDLRIVSDAAWQAVRARFAANAQRGGRRAGPPPRTLFGGLLKCAACGGAVIAVDARTYGCAARKDRGTCAGVRIKRATADARLLAAVRDDVLGADALAHVRQQVKALLAQAERQAGDDLRTAAERRRALEREVGRMVEAIATVGVSPALAERLRRAEAELASLTTSAAAEPRGRVSDAEIDAAFRRLVMRLQDHLQGDVTRARAILAELLGPVTIAQEGEEVWAEAAPDAAQLLRAAGGGVLLSMVAGGRFSSRKRWRLA
jgi:site-specific DNA recombinase